MMLEEAIKHFFPKDPWYVDNICVKGKEGFDEVLKWNLENVRGLPHEVFTFGERGFLVLVDDLFTNKYNLIQFFVSPENRKDGTKEEMMSFALNKIKGKGAYSGVHKRNDKIVRFYSRYGKISAESVADGLEIIIFEFKE